MSDTGWKSPGTVVDDSSVGTVAWSDPDYVKVFDGSLSGSVYGTTPILDNIVSIVNSDGSIGSENYANANAWQDIQYPDIPYISYGGENNLWGETWSKSDINDTDFGVVISSKDSSATPKVSHYLKATNFGFNIPENAQIKGIEVSIAKNSHYDTSYVDHIQIKVYYTEDCPVVGQKYALPPFRRS
jgi:hypothetical protein